MKYIAILVFFLSSCAMSPPKYIEPSSGALAEIKFINLGTGLGSMEFFKEQETCKGREYTDIIGVNGSQTLKVKAGSPLSFSFGYNVSQEYNSFTYCRSYATFNPEDKKIYHAVVSPGGYGCSLKVFEILNSGELKTLENIRYRTAKKGLAEGASWCK